MTQMWPSRRVRASPAPVRLSADMHDTPPVDLLGGALKALRDSFRFDHLVALSRERALYQAYDLVLKRPVALRLHLIPESPGRAWFLRETETLAALDHPAVRHVYAAGVVESYAYRTNNWIDGESLADAMHRGPRPVPAVMSLARDLLSALEHAHARNIIIRRIVPTTLMLDVSGRGVVTDLRHANTCMAFETTEATQTATPFCAPEVRAGGVGEPASDVERVLVRALGTRPGERYFTATGMLEDLVVDAGVFHEPAAEPQFVDAGFERRLRRALGDDYELLEELGSGGFGRVYRARDLGLEREVAIKVLHPALTADLGVVERFRREAQLAARLSHPNIVGIYDIQGRAGLQWYVMELVLGENLAQRVQRHGALSVAATERLLTEALSALEHAHGKGLVHRDLKPENTLIEPDGRLRITDFGLALALRGERFGGATSRSGTPQFASPEQLLGERVDPRTDLYSLGAVAYFALLGRPPFSGP